MSVTSTIIAFTIAIFVAGEPINGPDNRIGPFGDAAGCFEFRKDMDRDIASSFTKSMPYGMSMDIWGIGGGGIFRYQDYKLACVREIRDIETGELKSEMFFW